MIKNLKKYKIKNHINKKCKLVSDESSDSSCDSMSSSEMVITNLKCNRNHNLTEKGPIILHDDDSEEYECDLCEINGINQFKFYNCG